MNKKEDQEKFTFGIAVEVSLHLFTKIYELIGKYENSPNQSIPISEIKACIKEGLVDALSTEEVYKKIKKL